MNTSIDPTLDSLLRGMHETEASDLHLVPGYEAMYRVHGNLRGAGGDKLNTDRVMEMIKSICPPGAAERLSQGTDVDFAVQIDGAEATTRFRVNVFASRGDRGACFRAIPNEIPALADLGFPEPLAERILAQHNGLVLLTGITGSGKTTSLTALIQILNQRGGYRIITIEEPIEYIYPRMNTSVVTQREVGVDVKSFYDGLRYGLRQDADVLLVGEIRDRETAQLAVSAAETGHLIFATMHTSDAKGAITRLVDLFPSERHEDVRSQLSMSLRYVIAQHLLPTDGGGRRVLAMEALYANFAVRSAIRQGKIESIDSAIQSGRKDGMFSLDMDLRRLLAENAIGLDTARAFAKDPSEFGAGGGLY